MVHDSAGRLTRHRHNGETANKFSPNCAQVRTHQMVMNYAEFASAMQFVKEVLMKIQIKKVEKILATTLPNDDS